MPLLIAIDPSGNFEEGKGTTGIAIFEDGVLKNTSVISASGYECAEAYWIEHIEYITMLECKDVGNEVVCESYKLQKHRAMQQSGSWLETPQLIGYLRTACWDNNIPFTLQDPTIKTRFNDNVLECMGIIEKKGRSYFRNDKPITLHERDAIRHGLYYLRYGKKG